MSRGRLLIAMLVLVASPLAYANVEMPRATTLLPAPVQTLHQTLRTAAADSTLDAISSAGNWTVRHEALQRSPLGRIAGVFPDCPGHTATANESQREPSAQVIELPAVPGSGTLALSGLLMLGAWQAARSARNVQLASILHVAYVPDWYHADATQVGHSTPFEFGLTLQPILSICGLLALDPDPSRSLAVRSDEREHRLTSPQYSLLATAPRGPPVIS